MQRAVLLMVTLACATTAYSVPYSADGLLGVAEKYAAFYRHEEFFSCLDKSKTMSKHHVNDNYCDCADGSDEPATNACSNGRFFCHNHGHVGTYVPSWKVNDGICDCCDGSDEHARDDTKCENSCEELGRVVREEAERVSRIQTEGAQVKERYVSEAAAKLKELEDDLKNVRKELDEQTATYDDLLKKKDAAEEVENQERERLQAEWNTEMEHKVAQREAEKAAREAERAAQAPSGDDANAAPAADDNDAPVHEHSIVDDDYVPPGEDIPVTEDTLENEPEPEPASGDAEPEEPEEEPLEEFPGYTDPSAESARDLLRAAEQEKNRLESRIKEIEEEANRDYGPEKAYYALAGECFTKNEKNYVYKLCPFDKCHQQENNAGGSTLGRWKGFNDDYTKMIFEDGDRCWNGPNRSTNVDLVCGRENVLVFTDEPARCEYKFILETPAACSLDHLRVAEVDAALGIGGEE